MKIALFVLTLLLSLSLFAKSKGISTAIQATEGIYRGPRPLDLGELNKLKDQRIKSILNLQGGDLLSKYAKIIARYEPGESDLKINEEKENSLKIGLQFVHLPLNSLDPINSNEDKQIDEALAYISDKENQPVYIHCEHGKDRTGMIVALYKVKYEGMDPTEAYQEWVKLGHDKKSRRFTGNLDKYYFKKVKEIKGN